VLQEEAQLLLKKSCETLYQKLISLTACEKITELIQHEN